MSGLRTRLEVGSCFGRLALQVMPACATCTAGARAYSFRVVERTAVSDVLDWAERKKRKKRRTGQDRTGRDSCFVLKLSCFQASK